MTTRIMEYDNAKKILDGLIETPMEIQTEGGAVVLARNIHLSLDALPADQRGEYKSKLRKIGYDF